MKRVLLVHPSLNPPGGGRAVGAWTLQALRDTYRVDVLTWEPVNLAAINRQYGTGLRASDFRFHGVSPALRRLLPAGTFDLWKRNHLLRIAQQRHAQYDVFICTQNEADFGCRAIQYIHFPLFHDPRINPRVSRPFEAVPTSWYHRSPGFMRWYFRACGMGSWFSLARMRANLTLANSNWTARLIAQTHGIEATTLYPPVHSEFPAVPWNEREHGFVCVGRIAEEKRLPMIISILAAVRQRGHDIRLHITGAGNDREHCRVVRRLQQEQASWVSLDVDLPHAALMQLVSRYQYGIHGRAPEHFGIAVGEMVNAGCIVFVPNHGGQVEIVGNRAELTYDTVAEAVEKIDAVLRAPDRQTELRRCLASRRAQFSTDEFLRRMRATVDQFSG